MKEDEIYTKLFDFSRPTYFKWKREQVPIMKLIAKYFNKEDLEEFLERGIVRKYENFDTYKLDPIFEDYVIINLKRFQRMDRSFFNLFFPTPEFITRHLEKIEKYINQDNLTIKNAKEIFKDFIKNIKLSTVLDSETKRKKVIEDIDDKFSDIEIYLLIKYPHKFQ